MGAPSAAKASPTGARVRGHGIVDRATPIAVRDPVTPRTAPRFVIYEYRPYPGPFPIRSTAPGPTFAARPSPPPLAK